MQYDICVAGPADTPSIQQIARTVWPIAYRDILSPAQLRYMLDAFYSEQALLAQMHEKGHRFFLAKDSNGTPLGFASYSANDGLAHLHKLYVLPSTQVTGCGAAILRHCENEAKNIGASSMQLNVNRHNRATSFYEHHGYQVIFEEDIPIGRGYYMNDYRMEKQLLERTTV